MQCEFRYDRNTQVIWEHFRRNSSCVFSRSGGKVKWAPIPKLLPSIPYSALRNYKILPWKVVCPSRSSSKSTDDIARTSSSQVYCSSKAARHWHFALAIIPAVHFCKIIWSTTMRCRIPILILIRIHSPTNINRLRFIVWKISIIMANGNKAWSAAKQERSDQVQCQFRKESKIYTVCSLTNKY